MSDYSNYSIKTTGHSLGAALALLTALDLIKAGFEVTMYNFGQPRVGSKAFAQFASSKLSMFRVTHNKDIVPHIPVSLLRMEFYHSCMEIFENATEIVQSCDNNMKDGVCEDSNCADQYALSETNIEDHLTYLGIPIDCASVSN
mmetsp:Transcript_17659/g.25485  ORF Transcript_17659/g.25485 Transcript_17659/m.25485 type:complete len:144 (+) Transcript_17659:735-1166(+)